ncbi:L,D-transpeptidase [Sphingomonas sp. DT-204]|uniref:L,D-transpeptidase n=1 Tax=Sphingomonas sp. DT-204 TaxID=3396166 RepID=UPI003F1C45C7
MHPFVPALLLLSFCLPIGARAQGAKTSEPASERVFDLKPGQFVWEPDAAPQGPVVILVNLAEQFAVVYRNGVRIGATNVSTGKPGFTTPTGVFTILQKDANHHSSIYNKALMPYTERLTWSGVALHAGGLPGYPSSHGCIHLPLAFAKELFGVTTTGMTVVITDKPVRPATPTASALLAAYDPKGRNGAIAGEGAASGWMPDRAPAGPLSIIISGADRRLVVMRNGVEIGWTQLELGGGDPLGTHALTLVAGNGKDSNSSEFAKAGYTWHQVTLPSAASDNADGTAALARVSVPSGFLVQLLPMIEAGTTLVITDLSLSATGRAEPMTVIASK